MDRLYTCVSACKGGSCQSSKRKAGLTGALLEYAILLNCGGIAEANPSAGSKAATQASAKGFRGLHLRFVGGRCRAAFSGRIRLIFQAEDQPDAKNHSPQNGEGQHHAENGSVEKISGHAAPRSTRRPAPEYENW